MDGHCDCAEPTAAVSEQPPSGKLNKTAFKLFKRRKSGGGGGGGAMPSIFGVRSTKGRSGDGGGDAGVVGQATGGLVRSRTHDGLAELVQEKEKEEEDKAPSSSSSAAAAASCSPPPPPPPSSSPSVGKSHSFFSLLRKNGKGGERPKGRGGLKGLFSSMRWPRRDKPGGGGGGGREKEEEAGEESSEGPAAILMPGSLTASLECIKEEVPPRPPSPRSPPVTTIKHSIPDPQDPQAVAPQDAQELPLPASQGEEPPRIPSQEKESHAKPLETTTTTTADNDDKDGQATQEEPAITGCGDIIADPEDDVGGGGNGGGGLGSDKGAPGINKVGASKKPPGVVTYQGGGEEMASPEQVGDTCAPEFWDLLSQTEGKPPEMLRGKESPRASKDGGCAKGVQDESKVGQHIGFNHSHKEEQKSREKEQQEAIPSSDEGYWDSTTPGPEEDHTNNIQKEVIPRDSYSGDALYDLYTDPDENTATMTSAEDVTPVTCGKPLSPVMTTCPVKTHTTSLKDSKIPISIKHFTSPHSSHGPDASNSHHIAHHQPIKSEVPRTKIPVSKVLVHRASYRSLAGTTGKAATYHESAKK